MMFKERKAFVEAVFKKDNDTNTNWLILILLIITIIV